MEFIIIGIATAFNLIVIKMKLEAGRFGDAVLDIFFNIILNIIFGGTYSGMVVASITSVLTSIYLYFNPPKSLFKLDKNIKMPKIEPNEFLNEFTKRAQRKLT